MRGLIVAESITLDGVIDATQGLFERAGGEDDVSDVETVLRKQREAADALLLGRVTFEQMRGYWPLQTDDTTGISDYLNDASKYVVSSYAARPRVGAHGRAAERRRRPSAEVRYEREHRDHRQRQAGELIAAGLVDEYRLFTWFGFAVTSGVEERLRPAAS